MASNSAPPLELETFWGFNGNFPPTPTFILSEGILHCVEERTDRIVLELELSAYDQDVDAIFIFVLVLLVASNDVTRRCFPHQDTFPPV